MSVRLAFVVAAAAVLAGGQATSDGTEDPGLLITAESNLVVVRCHVYRNKEAVGGLGPDAFELREDGEIQDIAFVEGPPGEGEESERSVPTEIIFLIDFSLSVMEPGLLDFKTVRSAMLENLREDVLISIYGFANTLKRFTGPTRDLGALQKAMDLAFRSKALGSRVYQAIMQTARDAASRGGNASRMMVVFSDGFATTDLRPEIVVASAKALGIPIYPVILGHDRIIQRAQGRRGGHGALQGTLGGAGGRARDAQVFGPPRWPSGNQQRQSNARMQERRQAEFATIGPQTGGRSYDPDIINNLVIRQILASLATLAQTEYVLGYYPKAVDDEMTPHQVEVKLTKGAVGKLFGGQRLVVH